MGRKLQMISMSGEDTNRDWKITVNIDYSSYETTRVKLRGTGTQEIQRLQN